EIDAAVGCEHEAVQVVSGVVEAQAVTAMEDFAGFRLVLAGKFPERRNVGEPDIAAVNEHAGSDTVQRTAEVIGVNGGLVGRAIAVDILKQAEDFGFLRKRLHAFGTEVALDGLEPVSLRAVVEVVLEGPHVTADIEGAGAVTVGLGNKDATLLVEGEGDRVGQHGLGGPEVRSEAGGQLHATEGE